MFKKLIPKESHKDYRVLKRYPNGDIMRIKRLPDNRIFTARTYFWDEPIRVLNHCQFYNAIKHIIEYDDLTIGIILAHECNGGRISHKAYLNEIQ